MKAPDPSFTPNPKRAVYVQGIIDQDLIYRLTPQIISMQGESRDPITAYIDSSGGPVEHKSTLLRLLMAGSQLDRDPCLLITVALSLAASAAADLLSAGFYSLAHPTSLIMYHGVRGMTSQASLTAEQTYRLAQDLREGNEGFAVQLARDTEERFFFRFMSIYRLLPAVRAKGTVTGGTSDLDAFISLLIEKTSDSANAVLMSAYQRYLRYSELLNCVVKKWQKGRSNKTFVQFEVDQIKAIVDFEVKSNKKKKNWKFETEGIHRLTDDFFLVNQFLTFFQGERFKELALRWGRFLLTPSETLDIDNASPKDKDQKLLDIVGPRLRPVFSYFMALCHVLQQGDNYLSARDAFWLGLIDEVIGVSDLPTYRLFLEEARTVQKKTRPKATNGKGSVGAKSKKAG